MSSLRDLSISPLVHITQTSLRLNSVLMVMRTSARLAGIQLLEPPQIHGCGQKRDDIGVESLPVGVVEVVFLGLSWVLASPCLLKSRTSFLA